MNHTTHFLFALYCIPPTPQDGIYHNFCTLLCAAFFSFTLCSQLLQFEAGLKYEVLKRRARGTILAHDTVMTGSRMPHYTAPLHWPLVHVHLG